MMNLEPVRMGLQPTGWAFSQRTSGRRVPIECGTMLLLTTGRDSLTDAIDSQINTLTYRDQKSGLDRGTLVDEALRRLLVPRSSPFTIELALAARPELDRPRRNVSYRVQVQRAKMILYAAAGLTND